MERVLERADCVHIFFCSCVLLNKNRHNFANGNTYGNFNNESGNSNVQIQRNE